MTAVTNNRRRPWPPYDNPNPNQKNKKKQKKKKKKKKKNGGHDGGHQ